MTKMKRKTVAVMLILAIVISMMMSMTGCQGDDKASEKATGGETSQKETSNKSSESEDTNASEEPTVITIYADNFEKTFAAGFQDDPVMKAIEEKLNVKIDITPGNAVADYNAKLTAMMASRDLPDIVYVGDENIRRQMVSSKLALNLEPYMDKLNHVEDNRPGSFDRLSTKYSVDIDGNPVDGLHFIGLSGSGGNMYTPTVGFYVRWDLYKQLGYPEIKSYDDYIPLAKQMMELEPTNKNGKKNYGISAWFGEGGGWASWSLSIPFQWDAAIYSHPDQNREFDWETDDIQPSLTNPDSIFWTGVEWWNKAYREGIVDPDAFTQKWADYLDNVDKENRAMMAWAEFELNNGKATFATDGETEKGYIALPSPMTDRKARVMTSYASEGPRTYMINADSENIDKAVEVLNFLASWESTILIMNGIEGENWEMVDGKPQMKAETIEQLGSDPDYNLKSGVFKYHNMSGMGTTDIWPEYDVPARFTFMPNAFAKQLIPVEADACEYFGVDFPAQIVTQGKDITESNVGDRFIRFNNLPNEGGEVSERNKEISAKLLEIQNKDVYTAVLAETAEEFEKIKAELIEKAVKVGGVELFEYQKERFYNGQ